MYQVLTFNTLLFKMKYSLLMLATGVYMAASEQVLALFYETNNGSMFLIFDCATINLTLTINWFVYFRNDIYFGQHVNSRTCEFQKLFKAIPNCQINTQNSLSQSLPREFLLENAALNTWRRNHILAFKACDAKNAKH